jgi:hypothetical protein
MRFFAAFVFLFISFFAYSDDREIQRALIQRDQQSAEFARRGLDNLHASQLRDAGQQPPAYERQRMAQERELLLTNKQDTKKSVPDPDYRPLPLPGSGGAPVLVQPISTPSIGG